MNHQQQKTTCLSDQETIELVERRMRGKVAINFNGTKLEYSKKIYDEALRLNHFLFLKVDMDECVRVHWGHFGTADDGIRWSVVSVSPNEDGTKGIAIQLSKL